ncbi:YitT family protein [Flagellimonas hymeniacidonis]|uniref:YitT family protein n=1 Tax=Flagellimonas hymeniacidonis TaxID=2603628 RepID=A0A5C8V8N0_9FLAO|nr:YitT family protein [Flagellimonas hymeniacidonis]TXN38057.1 YitT family protein [Flagellimonas hymeniacidonis]
MKIPPILKDLFFILTGIFSAAFGLESFLLPNRFIDGGATGISLLVTEVTELPLWILIVLVNIPFLFLGYRVLGKQFTIKAILAILGLALVLAFIQFPEVTQDKLLVAVFGGFFLGAGIGLSIRGGSVLDGTEVLAIFLSRKLGAKIGDVIIMINIVIFLAAAYLLSIEAALYSMLTYLAASRTLDFVLEGIEEYTGVTIISERSEEIRVMITEKLGRGLTIYKASGGYGKKGEHNEYDVIYTVVTRLEIRKLNIELNKIDENAFVVMNSINDTKGGMVKKRVLNK